MSTAIARNLQVGTSVIATDNFTIFQPATPDGTLRIGNGNTGITTSLLTLNSSGNLGLGVTPSAWGAGIGAMQFRQGGVSVWALSGSNGYVYANAYYDGATNRYVNNGTACSYAINNSNGQHAWFTAPSGTAGGVISFTESMRIDPSGNLLVGITAQLADEKFRVASATTAGVFSNTTAASTRPVIYTLHAGSSGGTSKNHFEFLNSGGGSVGTIACTGTATAYNTSSDYRLKNTIAPMTGALAKVAALKPCTYKWNADGSDGEGFIAHELAEVVPDAVTGAKDAVDDDGKPIYQGIDTSFLVATLTAAIQELKAEFDAYKATHP